MESWTREELVALHERLGTALRLQAADLRDLDLSHLDLRRFDLSGSLLQGATLFETRLDGACFAGADLTDVVAVACHLDGAVFHKTICVRAAFRQARARSVSAQDTDFRSADFGQAYLLAARLLACDLRGANFEGADLSGADFSGSRIEGCSFDGALMNAAVFTPEQKSFLEEMGVSTDGLGPILPDYYGNM